MTRVRLMLVSAVSLVFVFAGAAPAAAGGGGCHTAPTADESGVAVKMVGFCMAPTVLHVRPGTTVTWTNDDPVVHNLWGAGWSRGELNPGQSATWTFESPGTYPYACTLHPGMTGAVVVDGAPATPVAAVRPAVPGDAATGDGSSAGGPLAIGLLAVVALGGAFAAGTRVRRPRPPRPNSA